MAKTVRDYINEKISEIEEICKELEYPTEVLDMDEYKIPTVLIYIDKNSADEDIIVTCNIVPMQIEGYTTLFIQFYMCISTTVPSYKKQEIYKFIEGQNDRLMIGNLLEFEDAVCVKYTLYLGSKDKIDLDFFAKALDIFIYQANIMSRKIDDILNDRVTVDKVLEQGTFYYE